MPLVDSDFVGLEWRNIAELSRDEVAIEEICRGLDTHTDNQRRFGFPDGKPGRLIAKIFLFRWIYLGSAYAYSKDPEFSHLGNEKYWQKIIDEFNGKYFGIAQWHKSMVTEAKSTGKVLNPITGRIYKHEPKITSWGVKWNESDIVNYPVQGFGADQAALVRIMTKERLAENGLVDDVKLLFPVHDSLVADCSWENNAWRKYVEILDSCVKDLPERFLKEYGYQLVVPHKLEHSIGVRYGWLHKQENFKHLGKNQGKLTKK